MSFDLTIYQISYLKECCFNIALNINTGAKIFLQGLTGLMSRFIFLLLFWNFYSLFAHMPRFTYNINGFRLGLTSSTLKVDV